MAPYIPINTRQAPEPEMEWIEGRTFSREEWKKLVFWLSPLLAMVVILPIMFVSTHFFGELTVPHFLADFIISLILCIIILRPMGEKGYRYALFRAKVPYADDTNGLSQVEYFRNVLDELLRLSDPILSVDKTGNFVALTYTFQETSCTFSMTIPLEKYGSDICYLNLKNTEPYDMPFLIELKEIVGMALEIEEPKSG